MALLEEMQKLENMQLSGDTGVVSHEDTATFNLLIAQHKETLNALAIKFLTTFKRRCSWSIACALIELYENLFQANPSDLNPRLILIYLIFRVAELDGTDVKGSRLAEQGHMSLPFLFRVADGGTFCHDRVATPIEKHVARLLLSCQPDVVGLLTAEKVAHMQIPLTGYPVDGQPKRSYDAVRALYAAEKARFPISVEKREDDGILDNILFRLFSGKVLNMSENRTLLDAITRAPPGSSLVLHFESLPRKEMAKFIEENVKIASDVIYKLVEKRPSSVHYYVSIMMEMELSVQCVESVLKLYTSELNLEREPLRAFVSHCLSSCDEVVGLPGKQTRHVRMVCLFVSSLLKKDILSVDTLSTEISDFVLRYSNHKDTTSLFQALSEARSRLSSSTRPPSLPR